MAATDLITVSHTCCVKFVEVSQINEYALLEQTLGNGREQGVLVLTCGFSQTKFTIFLLTN